MVVCFSASIAIAAGVLGASTGDAWGSSPEQRKAVDQHRGYVYYPFTPTSSKTDLAGRLTSATSR